MSENISPILLAQRVRNRIIEALELSSSCEEQRTYQDKVPLVHVPHEVINQWEDWVNPISVPGLVPPVFSQEEVAAITDFQAVWDDVCDKTPNPLPDLTTLQQSELWSRLREAARDSLAVFARRGRFPDDEPLTSWP